MPEAQAAILERHGPPNGKAAERKRCDAAAVAFFTRPRYAPRHHG
jgi:hypothetical protein